MGFKLRREVRDAIPPGKLSAAERLLVLEIADWCNDKTRRGWPGAEFLAELTDLSPRSIQETLSRVAQKWIELRVPLGTDKAGKPYYSHAGKRTTFEFPELTPVKGAIDQGPCDATDPGASAKEGATDPGGRCDGSVPKVRQIRGPSPQGSSSMNTSNPSFLADVDSPKIPNPREGEDGEFDSDQEQRINTLIGEILTLRPNDRRWTDKSVRAAIVKCLADGKPFDEIERAFPACAVDPDTGSPGRLPLDFYWWALPETPSRSEQRGSRPDYSTDVGTQPRSSQRGYESQKVNHDEPGARTAAWQRRRDANRDVPPGYRRRPDGSLLLVDSRADPRAYDEPL